MKPTSRRLAAIFIAAAVLGLGTAPVAAEPASAMAQARSVALTAGSNPCNDRAFSLMGGRWSQPLRWSFRASSTPAGLNRAAVTAVARRSFENIVDARNDCGRADKVNAEHVYRGVTARSPGITKRANCSGRDGANVVGFGPLPQGILAVTCVYFFVNFITEADIRINSRYDWAVSKSNCAGQELLEPTLTHEVGHAYGLGHVGERRHGLLTMSTRSDGACSNVASTLGLGDMLGLEKLY